MKNILLVVAAVVLLGGIYYVGTNKSAVEDDTEVINPVINENDNSADMPTDTVSGMRAEDNAVVATEQRPGRTVTIAQVYLAEPGYVVIHEDASGEAGVILGSSALLSAGENNKVVVTLSRETKNGEKLWSMLHTETNNNTTFEASTDTPVASRLGGPISGWFEISATAEENIEVTL